ncbi:universal stress protein family [Aciduliprofundum boonei T469]|nr:universal stress protein family [Aciduliprofundum boonei T469]
MGNFSAIYYFFSRLKINRMKPLFHPMIKRILVPTDGYGLENHVIKYVARVFPFADFHVVSVINTYERGVQLTSILYEEMKESAKKAVEEGKKLLENEGIHNVSFRILEGLPSREIVRYARENDIDLIAMRVYCRKSTVSAQRMGSTVANVLKRTHIPVLTLAEEIKKSEIKKVLLLTDGTAKSKRAENYAILLASSFGAGMEVLYIKDKKDGEHVKKLDNVVWKASHWNIEVKKNIESMENKDALLSHFNRNDIVVMGVGKKILFWRKIGHIAMFVATHSPIPVIFVNSFKKGWSQRR